MLRYPTSGNIHEKLQASFDWLFNGTGYRVVIYDAVYSPSGKRWFTISTLCCEVHLCTNLATVPDRSVPI